MRASGTFDVVDFTAAPVPPSEIKTGLPVGFATMRKAFTGEIQGRSETLFTSAFDPAGGTGTYVAMESFEGHIDGHEGTFNFVHSASTTGGGRQDEFLVIVPGSGTGGLAGVRGSGGLIVDGDGTHRIWFDYELS
ncbi:DUF3224 domain-containing protein [Actinoplanes missouriensis]|uniref:DUF3224 domain-containing protein n=1 Tax=Actinoplanes missouriensis TaxID=1866 RepID=UPI00340318FA